MRAPVGTTRSIPARPTCAACDFETPVAASKAMTSRRDGPRVLRGGTIGLRARQSVIDGANAPSRTLAVQEADDRRFVDPVDDADGAVALADPEDRPGRHVEPRREA